MAEVTGLTSQEAALLSMHQDMLSRALRSYWGNLKDSIGARRYMKERGVTLESVQRFGIGYAEASAQALSSTFPNYHVQSLVDCGLVIDGARGRYDRFRDRIMFPILNDSGRVIAFGGRLIAGDGPKYLNSPQTPLFDKGATLFGLPQARASIEECGEAIVVEGYMDVVMSAQHGIDNVVATLGTATTAAHIQKLVAVATRRIVFCFDGDDAGRGAAVKAMEACVEVVNSTHAQVAFTFLPSGEDPDSFVRQHGAEAFRKLIAEAMPFESFLMEHLRKEIDLLTCEGRAQMCYRALLVLPRIGDAGLYYRLCEMVGRDAGFTVAEMITLSGSEQQQRTWHSSREPVSVGSTGESAERQVSSSGKLRLA